MKKKKLLVLSALALSGVAVASLASCSGVDTPTTSEVQKEVSSISVSGGKNVFAVGDSFSKGALVVTASYSDGSTVDVTANATVNSSAVDLSKAGTYTVTVTFEGKSTTYSVEVKNLVLKSVSATVASKDFHYGDSLAAADLTVKATYTNPVDNTDSEVTLSAEDYTFEVKNASGDVVTVFNALGEYDVTVSYGEKSASVKVTAVKYSFDSVEGAIALAGEKESFVASGEIVAASTSQYNPDDEVSRSSENINYLYGTSYVKVTATSDYGYGSYTYDPEYMVAYKDGNGEDACITIDVPEEGQPYKSYTEHNLEATKGFEYDLFGGTNYSYGAAGLVSALYDLKNDAKASHFAESVGECANLENAAGYKFNLNYYYDRYGSYVFYRINVEFTLSDAGSVDKVYVKVEEFGKYSNYSDLEAIPADEQFTVTKTTDADGVSSYIVDFKDGASTQNGKTITVSQSVGAKAAESELPFDLKTAFYDSFDLKINGEVAESGKVYDVDLDTGADPDGGNNKRIQYELTIDNIAPESEVYFDGFEATLLGQTNSGYELSGGLSDWSYAMASFYGESGSVTFKYAGTYTLTVSSAYVTKTYTFNVSEQAPATVDSALYDGEGSDFVTADTYEMYVANTLYIKANIDSKFTQTYTAALAAGTENATLVADKALEKDCYKFNATAPGTYKVILTGAIPDCEGGVAATKEVTIVVSANPEVSSLLTGTKEAVVNGTKYSVVFTKNADTDLTGSVTITDTTDSTRTETASFTYDATNGFTVNHVSGSELGFDLALSSKFAVQLVDANGNKYELTEPKEDSGDSVLVSGKYTAPLMNGMFTYVAEFTVETNTTGTLVAQVEGNSTATGTYTYVVNGDGTVTLTLTEGTNVVGSYSLFIENGVLKVTAFGKTSEFTKEGGSSEGGETEGVTIHENFIGTWVNDHNEQFVVSETGATLFGDTEEIISCTETTLVVKDSWTTTTFTYNENGTISDQYENVWTKEGGSSEETPSVEINANFIGTWTCDNGSITITADTTEIQLGRNTLTIVNCTETLLQCIVNGEASNRFAFLYTASTNQLTDSDGNQYTKGEDSSSESVSFSGKYTAPFTFFGMNMTFEATFEGNNVTICIPENSSKNGKYSYEVGSDGTITLSFVEGSDVVGNHKLLIQGDKLCLNVFGNGTIVEFTKEGGSSEETPAVEINANFIGTWTSSFEDVIIVEEGNSTVVAEGKSLNVYGCDETTLILTDGYYTYMYTYNASTGTITDRNGTVYTKSSSEGAFSGKYTAQFKFASMNMTFEATFDGNNVTICIPEISSKSGKYSYEVGSDGTITLTLIEGTDTAGKHKIELQDGKLYLNVFGNGTLVELTK